ncbi:MAG TPA: hypothetical protein VFW58_02600, partial [Trichococcus sp.]|nr:hypothetical protein [Trichococcus sp.]
WRFSGGCILRIPGYALLIDKKKLHKSAIREPVEFFCGFFSAVEPSRMPQFSRTYLQEHGSGDKMKEISFIKK